MAPPLPCALENAATTLGISLLATSPGFKDFAHFFSSGYGTAMFAMAAASLSTTMVLPTPPAISPFPPPLHEFIAMTLALSLVLLVVFHVQITTPAAMVHNLGCAAHGARLYHFVNNRDSWKERDENMAKVRHRPTRLQFSAHWGCPRVFYAAWRFLMTDEKKSHH